MSTQKFELEFKSILYENDWFMKLLRTVSDCNLPDWFVGAGVIRSLIWDNLHKYLMPTPVKKGQSDSALLSALIVGAWGADNLYLVKVYIEWERKRALFHSRPGRKRRA